MRPSRDDSVLGMQLIRAGAGEGGGVECSGSLAHGSRTCHLTYMCLEDSLQQCEDLCASLAARWIVAVAVAKAVVEDSEARRVPVEMQLAQLQEECACLSARSVAGTAVLRAVHRDSQELLLARLERSEERYSLVSASVFRLAGDGRAAGTSGDGVVDVSAALDQVQERLFAGEREYAVLMGSKVAESAISAAVSDVQARSILELEAKLGAAEVRLQQALVDNQALAAPLQDLLQARARGGSEGGAASSGLAAQVVHAHQCLREEVAVAVARELELAALVQGLQQSEAALRVQCAEHACMASELSFTRAGLEQELAASACALAESRQSEASLRALADERAEQHASVMQQQEAVVRAVLEDCQELAARLVQGEQEHAACQLELQRVSSEVEQAGNAHRMLLSSLSALIGGVLQGMQQVDAATSVSVSSATAQQNILLEAVEELAGRQLQLQTELADSQGQLHARQVEVDTLLQEQADLGCRHAALMQGQQDGERALLDKRQEHAAQLAAWEQRADDLAARSASLQAQLEQLEAQHVQGQGQAGERAVQHLVKLAVAKAVLGAECDVQARSIRVLEAAVGAAEGQLQKAMAENQAIAAPLQDLLQAEALGAGASAASSSLAVQAVHAYRCLREEATLAHAREQELAALVQGLQQSEAALRVQCAEHACTASELSADKAGLEQELCASACALAECRQSVAALRVQCAELTYAASELSAVKADLEQEVRASACTLAECRQSEADLRMQADERAVQHLVTLAVTRAVLGTERDALANYLYDLMAAGFCYDPQQQQLWLAQEEEGVADNMLALEPGLSAQEASSDAFTLRFGPSASNTCVQHQARYEQEQEDEVRRGGGGRPHVSSSAAAGGLRGLACDDTAGELEGDGQPEERLGGVTGRHVSLRSNMIHEVWRLGGELCGLRV